MRPIYDSYRGGFPCDGLRRTGWADARRRKNRQFASLARSTAPTDLRGRIERGLRDGGRRAGPSQGMSDMDGRALRASAITPDGRHPGRTARQPFWPFCGGRAARRISMHGKWTELVVNFLWTGTLSMRFQSDAGRHLVYTRSTPSLHRVYTDLYRATMNARY